MLGLLFESAPTFAAWVPVGFVDELVSGSLSRPTALAFAPDGRIFVTQQTYGWPTFEGPSNDPGVRAPIFAYGHAAGALSGCAIVGGTFVPPTSPFNPAYAGRYLFADLCAGWIQAINPTPTVIATGVNQPIDLGFDGALYYVHSGDGWNLKRIRSLTVEPVPASSAGAVSSCSPLRSRLWARWL